MGSVSLKILGPIISPDNNNRIRGRGWKQPSPTMKRDFPPALQPHQGIMTTAKQGQIKWRLGSKVPINVYEVDRPICQCHTAEDARRIVAAVNAAVANHGEFSPGTSAINKSRILDLLILSSLSWLFLGALVSILLDHSADLKPIGVDWIPVSIGALAIAAMAVASTIAIYRSFK